MAALLISFFVVLVLTCQIGSTVFIVYADKLYHRVHYKYVKYERSDFWFDVGISLIWPISVPMYFWDEYLTARRELKNTNR